MGRYAALKREFAFLTKTYGFEISLKQKHGAHYYIVWSNPNKNIMVLYTPREKIRRAAQWLNNAIENKRIIV